MVGDVSGDVVLWVLTPNAVSYLFFSTHMIFQLF